LIQRTFLDYRHDISVAMKQSFKSKSEEFHYLLKIIENHLPDTFIRIKNAEQAERIAASYTSIYDTKEYVDSYRPIEKKKMNNRLADLF